MVSEQGEGSVAGCIIAAVVSGVLWAVIVHAIGCWMGAW